MTPEQFTPFDGDGRTKVFPTKHIQDSRPGAKPIGVTRATARQMIEHFAKTGETHHSAAGATLWVIETWCYYHDVDIKVVKHPFGGWWIKRLEDPEPEPEEIPPSNVLGNGFPFGHGEGEEFYGY